MVGERVDHTAVIPEYILDALKFAHPEIAPMVCVAEHQSVPGKERVRGFKVYHI